MMAVEFDTIPDALHTCLLSWTDRFDKPLVSLHYFKRLSNVLRYDYYSMGVTRQLCRGYPSIDTKRPDVQPIFGDSRGLVLPFKLTC